jgi:2-oxoglutarate ferredoxin oxidoreductase subunit delta
MADQAGVSSVRERARAFGVPKPRPVRAKIVIEWEQCKGCGFCVEFCPTGALKLSTEFNKKGYHPPVPDPEQCQDCGFCELVCPEFSIYSVDVTESESPGRSNGQDLVNESYR